MTNSQTKAMLRIKKLDEYMGGITHKNPPTPQQDKTNALEQVFDDPAENYAITASLALLTATISLLNNDSAQTVTLLLTISATLFGAALLMFVWIKLRHAKREKIYRKLYNDWKTKTLHNLSKLMDLSAEMTYLRTKVYLYEHSDEIEKQSEDETRAILGKLGADGSEMAYISEAIAYLMSSEAKQNYKASFEMPLDEERAKIKFIADKWFLQMRSKALFGGVLFLVVGLLLKTIPGFN